MAYAEKTTVSVAKTKADIEELVQNMALISSFPVTEVILL